MPDEKGGHDADAAALRRRPAVRLAAIGRVHDTRTHHQPHQQRRQQGKRHREAQVTCKGNERHTPARADLTPDAACRAPRFPRVARSRPRCSRAGAAPPRRVRRSAAAPRACRRGCGDSLIGRAEARDTAAVPSPSRDARCAARQSPRRPPAPARRARRCGSGAAQLRTRPVRRTRRRAAPISAARLSSRSALSRKRGSVRQLRPADQLAQLAELPVVADGDEDLAGAGRDTSRRAQGWGAGCRCGVGPLPLRK